MLKDVIALLDRWDVWKSVRANVEKVPELERRIAALEEMLGGKWPADVCLRCGDRAMRIYNSTMQQDTWVCGSCNFSDIRQKAPVRQPSRR